MLVIVGYIVVVGSVLGGFMLHGGKAAALFQPFELLIIAGGAIGAFVVGNNTKTLKLVREALAELLAKAESDVLDSMSRSEQKRYQGFEMQRHRIAG